MIGNINSSYYSSLYGISSLNRTSSYQQLYSALGSSSSLYGRNTVGSVDYSAVNSISSLKNSSKELQSSISALQSGTAFSKNAAISSNTDAMTVSSSSSTRANAPEMKVEISQVATGQQNQGDALNAKSLAQAGDYQVQVQVGGKSSLVSFRVNAGETNEQMQQKMASAINERNLGVKASVSTKNGQSTLTVESSSTGENASSFAIRDYVGNAVSKTGTAEATREAQNAVYSVNGKEFTSASNNVDLGNGVQATLRKATDEAITVSSGKDAKASATAVKDVLSEYNKLLNSADANNRLTRELSSVTKAYSSTLGRLGINVGSDGSLSVDESKLTAAAEDGRLQEFFTQDRGRSYGFSNQLNRVAGNVNRSTLNYSNSNPFVSSGYSSGNLYNSLLGTNQSNMMGMFFNLMI